MEDKIYNKNDYEFQSDGYLIVDSEKYFSIKTFKEEFKFNYSDLLENDEKNNDCDSQALQNLVNKNDIKKCISLNSQRYPYIFCFLMSDLEDYYRPKLNIE